MSSYAEGFDIGAYTNPLLIGDKKVILSFTMREDFSERVPRTLLERLFSFTPFTKTKLIWYSLPSSTIVVQGDTLTMHPAMLKVLLKHRGEEG